MNPNQYLVKNLRTDLNRLAAAHEAAATDIRELANQLKEEDIESYRQSALASNVGRVIFDSFNTSNQVSAAQVAIYTANEIVAS